MSEILPVLILAIVQGIAEFLPISSSGHVVIVESLYEQFTDQSLPDLLLLNVVLHAGTLLSIFVVFWHRIWRLLGEDRRLLGLLFVGSLPAAAVGLWLRCSHRDVLENPTLAGCMLLVTSALLWSTTRCQPGDVTYTRLNYGQSFIIGIFQSLALLPGLSRSGSTIVSGMWLGLRRDDAATFSFLLVIPAISGACLLESIEAYRSSAPGLGWATLACGAIVSFLVGVASLLWLLRWLQQGRLHYFAWWCFPLGCAILVWQLWPKAG